MEDLERKNSLQLFAPQTGRSMDKSISGMASIISLTLLSVLTKVYLIKFWTLTTQLVPTIANVDFVRVSLTVKLMKVHAMTPRARSHAKEYFVEDLLKQETCRNKNCLWTSTCRPYTFSTKKCTCHASPQHDASLLDVWQLFRDVFQPLQLSECSIVGTQLSSSII